MPVLRGKRVRIPRCRATVSEDTADVHWAIFTMKSRRPGKDARRRWTHQVLTRKPGDRREPSPRNPFACKGEWYGSLPGFRWISNLYAGGSRRRTSYQGCRSALGGGGRSVGVGLQGG